MFTLHVNNQILVHLLYVDMVITGSNYGLLCHIITTLGSEFSMKDLGPLYYFLGVEAVSSSAGLFLTQAKYAYKLLARASMLESKSLATPMPINHKLIAVGIPLDDPSSF